MARSAGFHETFLERETPHRPAGELRARLGRRSCGRRSTRSPTSWTRATGAAEANGLTQPYVSAVAYGSAFYAFLAVLLSIRARSRIRRSASAAASPRRLAVWLGTPLLFYMYVAPPFSHACSAFAVALFVNVWLHVRRDWSPGGALALGLLRGADGDGSRAGRLSGARTGSRFHAWSAAAERLGAQRHSGCSRACGGHRGHGVVGLPPSAARLQRTQWLPGTGRTRVARKMYWYAPHGLQVLASPSHGFLFWTPLAILAIAGLFIAPHDAERRAIASRCSMVASQVYVAGSVESWTVAGAFGQRRFVCLTTILVDRSRGALTAARCPRTVQACIGVAVGAVRVVERRVDRAVRAPA